MPADTCIPEHTRSLELVEDVDPVEEIVAECSWKPCESELSRIPRVYIRRTRHGQRETGI